MILSTPFSRHNRNHQTWSQSSHGNHHNSHNNTNNNNNSNHLLRSSNSFKKPAPQQPAPAQPSPAAPAPNGTSFRSHTLDRVQRRRWNQAQQTMSSTPKPSPLRRNLSSLGHYPETREPNPYSSPSGVLTSNASQIYAPASIASPSEFTAKQFKQPPVANGDSQHYASTSYRGVAGASESGKSGRESALGHLLERFGTLRRRTKWLRPSRSKTAPAAANGVGTAINPDPTLPPHLQPTPLDPEVYATGKRQVEADAIYAEGLIALDGNCQKRLLQYELNEAIMSEGETRTIIEEQSQSRPDYQELIITLTNWINDELAQQRIIVKDLQDDLYDGQILGKLIEKLNNIQLDIVEVTQNETTQRYKLRTVLDTINRILSLRAKWARIRWTVEGIHGKNMVEIVQLLVTLAIFYRAPIKLTPNVRVMVLVIQKCHGQLVKRSHEVQLTDSVLSGSSDATRPQDSAKSSGLVQNTRFDAKRDAFDALIEFAPDKLAIVEQSLVNFVNRHLNKINITCSAAGPNQVLNPEQFSDGLMLVFLIASLEDYFVPLGNLFTVAPSPPPQPPPLPPTNVYQQPAKSDHLVDINNNFNGSLEMAETAIEPTSYINTLPIHKLHNVNVALQLIEEAGIPIRDQVRADDLVNGDLKSVLRVLYALFSRYKHL